MNKTFALALLAYSLHAGAEEKQLAPIDQFRLDTKVQLTLCRYDVKLGMALGDTNTIQIRKCFRDGKQKVKEAFAPALTSVRSNTSATAILKDFYASWITTFDALPTIGSESVARYDERQAAAETKVSELWNRLEIELGTQ